MNNHLYSCALVALVGSTGSAAAQDIPEPARIQAADADNVIVVTAQRRAQDLNDVPISISAFDQTFLEQSRVATVDDLVEFTPGVNGTNVSTTTPRINIRGVSTEDFGIGSDPVLGIYVDDVYLGRGVSSINDLFDVERVEVVKGPQGSLFGRNTTAGAISIVSNKPDPAGFGARTSASFGNFGAVTGQASVNVAIGETTAFRLAGSYRSRDGFIDNTLGGDLGDTLTYAGRASLSHEGDTFSALLSAEYRVTRDGGNGYVNRVLVSDDPFGPISSDLGEAARDDIDSYRVVLQLKKEFGEVTLTSITGFSGFGNQNYLEDTDASPLTLIHFGTNGSQDTFSQELRLNGSSGRLDWFFGASAAFDDVRSTQFGQYDEDTFCAVLTEFAAAGCADFIGVPGSGLVTESSIASGQYENYAIYGDLTYAVADRFDVTVGLRYSYDKKDFSVRLPAPDNLLGPILITPPDPDFAATVGDVLPDGTVRQRGSWDSLQPRLAASYAVTDDVNLYASATRGFKSGGFNQLAVGSAFDPENIWSLEVGSKGRVLDGIVNYSLAAYYYTYDDLQVLVQVPGIPAPVTQNAGSSEGYGLEAQLDIRPVRGLRLLAGGALGNAEYTRFVTASGADNSGNALVRSPDVTGSVIADYRQPVGKGSSEFFRARRIQLPVRDFLPTRKWRGYPAGGLFAGQCQPRSKLRGRSL